MWHNATQDDEQRRRIWFIFCDHFVTSEALKQPMCVYKTNIPQTSAQTYAASVSHLHTFDSHSLPNRHIQATFRSKVAQN